MTIWHGKAQVGKVLRFIINPVQVIPMLLVVLAHAAVARVGGFEVPMDVDSLVFHQLSTTESNQEL